MGGCEGLGEGRLLCLVSAQRRCCKELLPAQATSFPPPRCQHPNCGDPTALTALTDQASQVANWHMHSPYYPDSFQAAIGTSINVPIVLTAPTGRGAQMADWRKRVHEARRRTMIVIIAMLRLRKGHKHHPQRPFRCGLEQRG